MLAASRRLNEHMKTELHTTRRFAEQISATPDYSPFGRAVLFFSQPPAAPSHGAVAVAIRWSVARTKEQDRWKKESSHDCRDATGL
jgi:hypothetical protein